MTEKCGTHLISGVIPQRVDLTDGSWYYLSGGALPPVGSTTRVRYYLTRDRRWSPAEADWWGLVPEPRQKNGHRLDGGGPWYYLTGSGAMVAAVALLRQRLLVPGCSDWRDGHLAPVSRTESPGTTARFLRCHDDRPAERWERVVLALATAVAAMATAGS